MHAEPKKGDIIQFTKQIHVWKGKANTQASARIKVMNKDMCLVLGIVDLGSNVAGLRARWVADQRARWVELLCNGQIVHLSSNAYGKSFHTIIPADPKVSTIGPPRHTPTKQQTITW